jgi:beta-N-acetylhexosaminidase
MRFTLFAFFYLRTIACFGGDLLYEMSLEEKVGQVLMAHFYGEEMNEEAKRLVQDVKVGGIIYYNWANGLTSPSQVQSLSFDLQQLAQKNRHGLPLLIAADQEGGLVARLQAGFTIFPGNRALQAAGDPDLARKAAFAMGEELRAVGINMNLAPVVDVNNNLKNPVIGIRSFGEDAESVALFGEKALLGFKEAGVIATLKHFPGHGDVEVDSHEDLPVIYKSKEALEKVELLPFAKLAGSADAIMTAHILVPALDLNYCSTLSEKTLNFLREDLGFEGVIVSDSLVMGGVLKKCSSIDEASILALDAGCDLLILGGKLLVSEQTSLELKADDIERIHGSIVEAVKTGRLSEAKLDKAVERILRLKKRYLKEEICKDFAEKVNTLEHRALAEKIASLSLQTIEKNLTRIAQLNNKKLFIVAPSMLQGVLSKTSLFYVGKEREFYFFNELTFSNIEEIKKQAESADVILICSYNAWKNPHAINLTESLLGIEKPSILLVLRDPLDASLFPQADLIYQSFSPTVPSIQAICDQLVKK